jgi:hypothetical protein
MTGEGVHGDGGRVGVSGNSQANTGVSGVGGKVGVSGASTDGIGVTAKSSSGTGVVGESSSGTGVHGINGKGASAKTNVGSGVWGESENGNGVSGISQNAIGVFGKGGRLAGRFEGDVEVEGDIRVLLNHDIRLMNADCAEDFDVSGVEKVEPGTVMVLNREGTLQQSRQAYDKRVAGVISGAGDFRPGIVLDKQQSQRNRMPIALLGKVFCKADAQYSPIEVGDLLTTSATPGHAMRVEDPLKAFGAVIGKALRPLSAGQGLIPILIALQ